MKKNGNTGHGRRMNKGIKIVLIVIAVLVIIRLILPSVVLRLANNSLEKLEGYHGHIDDIDIALFRGAYKIDSIYINKLDSASGKETPFFAAKEIDLSVEWGALFHGAIVGELVFEEPMLRFTKDKVEPDEVRKDSSDFRTVLKDLMPLQINRFEINDGRIQYIDNYSKPPVDIQMTNTHILAQNLKNSYDSTAELPARVSMTSSMYDGTLTCNVKLNPLAEEPTFDLNAELKSMNLVKVNDFFKAYAKVDVNQGTFGLYLEAAAKDGNFTGYVKPLIKNLDVLGEEDRDDNIFRKLWEGLAGGIGQLFKNPPRDQVASKIPFQGSLKDPKTNLWYAIGNILQNAFIRALQPAIDNEIGIGSVETDAEKEKDKNVFEKVFGGKDKDKKDEKK